MKVKLLTLFLHIHYIYTFTYTLRIYFFTYTLCITYLLLLLVQIPDSHLLTISVDLSCPEYHTSGIIQSLAFFDLFLSLSSINLRFIFEWMNSLFPFNAGWYSILQMYHYLFIHSHTEGHLGCYKFLTIINKASVNICLLVIVWHKFLNTG